MFLLTNFTFESRILWRSLLLPVHASSDGDGGVDVDIYVKIQTRNSPGQSPGHSPGDTFSRRHRTSLREALEIRIADFKGCVFLPLLLLLFE